MALVETGSRGLLGTEFGPRSYGENHYAQRLLHLLDPDMLVLPDRGFDDGKLLAKAAATGAQFLVRLTTSPRPARTAPAFTTDTGWPPPCSIPIWTPLRRSCGSTTKAGRSNPPTTPCATPS
ncbi:hypothetical protein ABZ766_15590 [Streptomyces sp. NPDC006670]|uniref:hypothetical protein n=1 Tax=Streptomyces sp. NPDC006670 TaxID=3154476 RepID=UPI0033C61258